MGFKVTEERRESESHMGVFCGQVLKMVSMTSFCQNPIKCPLSSKRNGVVMVSEGRENEF